VTDTAPAAAPDPAIRDAIALRAALLPNPPWRDAAALRRSGACAAMLLRARRKINRAARSAPTRLALPRRLPNPTSGVRALACARVGLDI
jgi:hypothetical protein